MSDDLRTLRDEVALLGRSLEDARAEHARGELDDAGLAAIERRDGARLAAAQAQLEARAGEEGPGPVDVRVDAPPEGAPDPSRRRRRPRGLLAVGVGCLAAAALVVGLAAVDPFAAAPANEKVTKGTQVQALLLEAEELVGTDHPLRAITAFDAVLRIAPRNAEALVESAWLRYEDARRFGPHAGEEVAAGASGLRRAVRLVPRSASAHFYDGVVLYQHFHDRAGARHQLLLAAALPQSTSEQHQTLDLLAAIAQG